MDSSQRPPIVECRVFFDPPPEGSIITSAFAKVADVAGSTLTFQKNLPIRKRLC
jgi:hypothetical protein